MCTLPHSHTWEESTFLSRTYAFMIKLWLQAARGYIQNINVRLLRFVFRRSALSEVNTILSLCETRRTASSQTLMKFATYRAHIVRTEAAMRGGWRFGGRVGQGCRNAALYNLRRSDKPAYTQFFTASRPNSWITDIVLHFQNIRECRVEGAGSIRSHVVYRRHAVRPAFRKKEICIIVTMNNEPPLLLWLAATVRRERD